jgi:glycosyltransferase involved in cell wall biosynthesis
MKNVLIIAHAFPPIGGIAVQRVLKFTKYLPAYGWQPLILTVAHSPSFMLDHSLTQELPANLPIYRARSWEPLNAAQVKQTAEKLTTGGGAARQLQQRLFRLLRPLYFALRIPDDKIGWYPFAVKLGRQVMQQANIDLIFATAPPYTNLLVGKALKRTSCKPLVVDYRDEWSTIRYQDYPTNALTSFLNRRLETGVLAAADHLVTANPGFVENLRRAKLLPATTAQSMVMNGFDPADYQLAALPPKSPRFSVVYTGTLYGERRTPKYFLQALAQLLQAKPDLRSQVRACFVGTIYDKHASLVQEYGLGDVVALMGMAPHQVAVQQQLLADVLLLIVGNGVGSEVVLTGKVFEYFGARRPILALAPLDGPAAQLIGETNTGWVVDSEDVSSICRKLDQLYTDWSAQRLHYAPNTDLVQRYDRRTLTRQLAQLFDQLTASGSAG